MRKSRVTTEQIGRVLQEWEAWRPTPHSTPPTRSHVPSFLIKELPVIPSGDASGEVHLAIAMHNDLCETTAQVNGVACSSSRPAFHPDLHPRYPPTSERRATAAPLDTAPSTPLRRATESG